MSTQNRTFSAPQLSPANFVPPVPPIGSSSSISIHQNMAYGGFTNSMSSTTVYHRNPPRDPFSLSAPPTNQMSTLPGSGGLFLSPSVNSHTGFTPARIGSNKTEAPIMKPPKPPEKPLMPYMRYSRRMWDKVRSTNPDSKLWDIGKIIGQMWREMPESARQVYVDEYEAEKQEYDRTLKAYHNSPSYQAYLLSKNRGGRAGEKSSATVESGVYIQPVDEDEDMGQYSAKQLAASRFHRNHRLMKEIFSETQVPDARNVITAQRLGVLKKQVNSLTLHQNKLEEELKQLEVRFESKKRKMAESSAQFASTLKKICSHKMEPFEDLVERAKTQLLNAYEQYKLNELKQREALAAAELARAQAISGDQTPPAILNEELEPKTSSENDVDQTMTTIAVETGASAEPNILVSAIGVEHEEQEPKPLDNSNPTESATQPMDQDIGVAENAVIDGATSESSGISHVMTSGEQGDDSVGKEPGDVDESQNASTDQNDDTTASLVPREDSGESSQEA